MTIELKFQNIYNDVQFKHRCSTDRYYYSVIASNSPHLFPFEILVRKGTSNRNRLITSFSIISLKRVMNKSIISGSSGTSKINSSWICMTREDRANFYLCVADKLSIRFRATSEYSLEEDGEDSFEEERI